LPAGENPAVSMTIVVLALDNIRRGTTGYLGITSIASVKLAFLHVP